MSESHSLKYVHVDTLNRKAGETKSRITVHVPQGLENCSRVALKSFSIPNTFPNMVSKKIQWIEMIQTVGNGNPIWKMALFTILMDDLDTDQTYLDNVNLQFELQTRFQNDGSVTIYKTEISENGLEFVDVGERTHNVNWEVEMPITIVYDKESFKFKLHGKQNSGTQHKFMILYDDESDQSLWHHMGFQQEKLMTKGKFSEFLSQAYQSLETTTSAKEYNTTNQLLKNVYGKDMRDVTENTLKIRYIYAGHASKHENHIGKINLCSDLASDSFIMGDNGTLRNTDILESIVNNVPKFSYIHYSADTLYFHNLNRADVHKFDLRLYESDDLKALVDEVLPNWSAVLVFEKNLEMEYHKEDTTRMNEFAYTLGHPTR
jgi:hypothetical protein